MSHVEQFIGVTFELSECAFDVVMVRSPYGMVTVAAAQMR